MNKINRRQFAIAASSMVALNILGCNNTDDAANHAAEKSKAAFPIEPFLIGTIDTFSSVGIYTQFNYDKRFWLVNNGQYLIALQDVCTHNYCALTYDASLKLFECPCHLSQFDLQGEPLAGSKASKPLKRLAIKLVNTQIQIDPTILFGKDAWGASSAKLLF